MPLEIELAGGRVDAFGTRGVAALLDDRFHLLMHGRRTALPRHRTLGGTLDWSLRISAGAGPLVLRRLSIFVFGLSRDMACTIASDIGTSESDAVEALAGLVAKSLLNADANTSVRTYRLLETTLAYAHAELRQTSSVRKLRAGTQSISCIGLLPQKLAYSQRQLLVSSPISPPLLTMSVLLSPGPPRRTVMSRSESRLWRQLRRCGSVRRCTRSAATMSSAPWRARCWPTVITRGRRCSSPLRLAQC